MRERILKTTIFIGLFVVLPLVAADVRIDKVFSLQNVQQHHQHDEKCVIACTNFFEELMRKHYYSSMFINSAWSNWHENLRNLLARIKGEDAKKVIMALNQQSVLSFEELSDDETGDSFVEIYTTKCKKEVITKK